MQAFEAPIDQDQDLYLMQMKDVFLLQNSAKKT